MDNEVYYCKLCNKFYTDQQNHTKTKTHQLKHKKLIKKCEDILLEGAISLKIK